MAEHEAQKLTDEKPRCWRCNRALAYVVTRPWQIKCSKCNATNGSAPFSSAESV